MNRPKIVEWPEEHRESLPRCPVCKSNDRLLRHEALIDKTFFTAAGRWNLWECRCCNSGWLDPRPDKASIHAAYGSYYTHCEGPQPKRNNSFKNTLGNGYRNWRYGLKLQPASWLGIPAASFLPKYRSLVDNQLRRIPKISRSVSPKFIDIGCGNGDYLKLIREAGWQCAGVEPDRKAREVALRVGFDIRESLENFAGDVGKFGFASMSHVIEHMHDPIGALASVFALLKRGGGVFVATPNMHAVGHRMYGRHWRGLEPPRHLLLFSRQSLDNALREAGFVDREFYACPGVFAHMVQQSRRIRAGEDPYDDTAFGVGPQPSWEESLRAEAVGPEAEFLIVTAKKP